MYVTHITGNRRGFVEVKDQLELKAGCIVTAYMRPTVCMCASHKHSTLVRLWKLQNLCLIDKLMVMQATKTPY